VAKILPAVVSPIVPRTIGGSTFYESQGRIFSRQRVTPVYPRSAFQMDEVAGVTAGARAGAYQATPEEVASYADAGCEAVKPWEVWIWIWSLLKWVKVQLPVIASGGPAGTTPSLDAFEFDPTLGSMMVTAGWSGGGVDPLIRVRASRPMKAGRLPRAEDFRVVGTAEPGVPVDIGPSVAERFGGLPQLGTTFGLGLTFGDPSGMSASCETEVLIDLTPGGSSSCFIQCPIPSVPCWVPWDCEITPQLLGPDAAACDLMSQTPGFEVVSGYDVRNAVPSAFQIEQFICYVGQVDMVIRCSLQSDPNVWADCNVTLYLEG